MPNPPKSKVKQVIQGAPIIQVTDPLETATYYRDVLGFDFDFGSESYAVVWRDNAAIHFARSDELASGVRVFLWVKNVHDMRLRRPTRGLQHRLGRQFWSSSEQVGDQKHNPASITTGTKLFEAANKIRCSTKLHRGE